MIEDRSYSFFLMLAVLLHMILAISLFWEHNNNERPALTMEANNAAPKVRQPEHAEERVIKAVTVDEHEVMAAVNQLKKEREQKVLLEANRQKSLAMQAEAARQKRIQEQQKIERLKQESDALLLTQKKKLEEEKKKMQALAKQQALRQKELKVLQEKQEEVKKQNELEEKNLAAVRVQHEIDAKARELEEKRKQEEIVRAAEDSAKKIKIAGVVDRYKALIINAISQQWILPDHIDNRLSSQFRIRLAPNGTVLEVTLTRSSGDPILDRSAQSAIYKASPLPVPSDPEMFNVFRDISLTVRPENAQG